MKYVKLLGLCAVAAMALMAFVGAGSASATVLCKTASSPCNSVYTGALDASLEGSATLSSGGTTLDTCTEGTVKGNVLTDGPTSTVTGPITSLTWGKCTNTTDTIANGELELHHITGTTNGTLTGKGSKVTVLTLGVSCTYGTGTGTDLGTFTGGNPATIDIDATVPLIEGSFICPGTATWVASYKVTEPTGTLDVEAS